MKTFKYIMIFALACSLTTSCMDGDWDEPELTGDEVGIGNKELKETNVVSIAELKELYKDYIATDYRDGNSFAQVTEDMQIKAVVTGNDVQGNLYNEIAVDDGTGAIIIAIAQGGLFGQLPVGAEILVDLKDLYVGNYGKQAEIGTPYTNARGQTYVSRMSRTLWGQHFKLTGETKTIEPIEFDKSITINKYGTVYDGKLVTLKNVSFKGADGTATYANAGGGAGSKNVYFNEYSNKLIMLYTSNFADFAANAMPTGKVNVTGIMKRFNNTWEIIIRTLDDVEEVK
ncbi:MAG: DUF5689 domain-containing protein [Prevotella sp.]|jgi:hypothetical protein